MRKSTKLEAKDFAAEGVDIQTAMIRHVQSNPDRTTRTKYILWNGDQVWTSCDLEVPKKGCFSIKFLSDPREPTQGVDVKLKDGAIHLSEGERVKILRTWHDPRYEEVVEYPYASNDGRLSIWNVFHRRWPDGRMTAEKWTGNAGFLIERESNHRWLFHCSSGPQEVPDFKQLVFRFSIS